MRPRVLFPAGRLSAALFLLAGLLLFTAAVAAADPPTADDPLAAAKAGYEEAIAAARERLLADFDAREKLVQSRGGISVDQRIEILKTLRTEKEEYGGLGKIPAGGEMTGAVNIYRRSEKAARAKCYAAFQQAADAAVKEGRVEQAEAILAEGKKFLGPEPGSDEAADAADEEEGWTPLFNGKDLTGWRSVGDEKWSVEKGVIVCQGGQEGFLATEKGYKDFELKLEYRWPKEGANSGVTIHTPVGGHPHDGVELELIDDVNFRKYFKRPLLPTEHTGAIVRLTPVARVVNKPIGQWNKVHIVVDGRKISFRQNGVELMNVDLSEHFQAAIQRPSLKRTEGAVSLQRHIGKVEFRNIKIKEF